MPKITSDMTPSITPSPTVTFTPTITPIPPELLPLRARFSEVLLGRSIRFTDRSEGVIDSWLWDFGDGSTSTERSPIYTYAEDGRYAVTLTIRGEGIASSLIRAYDVANPTCVLRPRGRVRMRATPSNNAQTLFFFVGNHAPITDAAVRDADGVTWYRVRTSTIGWVRADQMDVVSGECPQPPIEE